ncbi:MAG: hypothetical protein A3H29_13550 [Acidobacteria bacterium RIFCSPLOWO2_02_FULL_67_21]|nr:MAG: hypothetical protein A3H29_13550 [Acidobacteria bacterium RIFCSPLOWO2_02_FULL_67_21]
MARSVVLAAPGPLDARTGGYVYNRRILGELARRGWAVSTLELDPSFPSPTPAALEQAAGSLQAIPDGTIVVVDSLALGAMPAVVVREASRLRVVALVHLPLAATAGLDAATAARFRHDEGIALRAAALVIVTGRAALPLLVPYGIPDDRVLVIEPGTDRPLRNDPPHVAGLKPGTTNSYVVPGFSRADPPAYVVPGFSRADPPAYVVPGFSRADTVMLICVATIKAGKGHELLLATLGAVPHSNWHLTCAGSLTRDTATVDRVRAAIERFHLEDRVTLAGALEGDALEACYEQADVFVMATQQETYGMAVAEALAHGLPVVATRTDAVVDLVGDEAGLLVPVDDEPSLRDALTRIIGDASLRARLAEGARRAGSRLPTWDEASRKMAQAFDRLAAHG